MAAGKMHMTRFNAGSVSLIAVAGVLTAGLSGCGHVHGYSGSEGFGSESHSDSGGLTITKMGGGIDVDSAPHGATLTTMGGGIHVRDVASFAKLHTMGGGIEIDHSTGSVDAATMGGGVSIHSADGSIKATTMGGDIVARMVGTSTTERDVELTSHGGNITLTVPKDFPMDVRITLAYTKNAPRSYEINDHHIGMQQRETQDWDMSHGSPRKYIRAQGRVGNGLNHVVINTENGDVTLKQE